MRVMRVLHLINNLLMGFNSYIPLAFEKKFYPSPLSVLNSLTINDLTASDGTSINNLRDNLEISRIDNPS